MPKDEKNVTAKMLKDVKKVFLNKPSKGILITFFSCLLEADLYVPMNAFVSKEDEEKMNSLNVGDIFQAQKIRMKPDFLFDGKNIYLPIFSDMDEVLPEYRQRFSWINLSIDDCVKLLNYNKDAIGLVIDPFTDSLKIKNDLLKILTDMIEFKKEKETKQG